MPVVFPVICARASDRKSEWPTSLGALASVSSRSVLPSELISGEV